ncbi:MAG: 30S ribosome-binding factor RbfA, partial [Pseudomonadota bacterium]
MQKEYSRSERMGSQIQRELALLIQHSLKDPGLGSPSILEVQVSKDLSHARVYFSVLNADDAAACGDALKRAAGFLQREIGKTLKSRVTPKLSFFYDDTDIRGRQLS